MLNLITSPGEVDKEFKQLKHAKNCFEVLQQHYPGWAWAIGISDCGSMTDIRNHNISGSRGYRLHTRRLSGDALSQSVIKAGGEILERAKMSRGRFNEEKYSDLKTDHTGKIIHETT